MIGRYGTKLAVWLLRYGKLGNQDRQLLTAVMLDRLGALPIHDKVVIDDTGVLIDGRPMTLEAGRRLHEASKALLKNFAYKVVREQMTFRAVNLGVHQNVSPEQGLFAKAALWWKQEEYELYLQFAQLEAGEDGQ